MIFLKKNKNGKFISTVGLIAAIIVLFLGIMAFTSTLGSSLAAEVKPDNLAFNVELHSSLVTDNTSSAVVGIADGGTAGVAEIGVDKLTISDLTATFTEPGQSVKYTFYAHNTGGYDAYLQKVVFNTVEGSDQTKVCSLPVCDDITMTVDANGIAVMDTSVLYGKTLVSGSFEIITVTIEYSANANKLAGDVHVAFGDVSLSYIPVEGMDNEVVFMMVEDDYITEYRALEGMSWEEWSTSYYNASNYSNKGSYIGDDNNTCIADNGVCVDPSSTIEIEHSYSVLVN